METNPVVLRQVLTDLVKAYIRDMKEFAPGISPKDDIWEVQKALEALCKRCATWDAIGADGRASTWTSIITGILDASGPHTCPD